MEGQAMDSSEQSLHRLSCGLSDETNALRTLGSKDAVSGTMFPAQNISSLDSHGSSAQEVGDQLTESNIKWGYYARPIVDNEHLSAFDSVREKIFELGFCKRLSTKLGDLFEMHALVSTLPKESIDTKQVELKVWITEYLQSKSAHSHQPFLHTIPAAFTADQLLETMIQLKVPDESSTLLSTALQTTHSPSKDAAHARTLWTNTLTAYLQTLYDKLGIAKEPASDKRTLSNSKKSSKVSEKPKKREMVDDMIEALLSKWNDGVSFLTLHYNQGYLDNRLVLKWVLDGLKNPTFGQTELMLPLASFFVPEFAQSNSLTKYLFESSREIFIKLKPFVQSPKIETQSHAVQILIKKLFECNPDMLALPKYSIAFKNTFGLQDSSENGRLQTRQRRLDFYATNKRFCTIPEKLEKLCESLSTDFQFNELNVKQQVHSVCKWAIHSLLQEQSAYVAAYALQKACTKHGHNLSVHLQDYLTEFLLNSKIDLYPLYRICYFFGELVRRKLFSYPEFLNTLVRLGVLLDNSKHEYNCLLAGHIPNHLLSREEVNFRRLFVSSDSEKGALSNIQLKIVKALPKMFIDDAHVDTRRERPRRDLATELDWCRLDQTLLETLESMSNPFLQSRIASWIVEQVQAFVVQKKEIGIDNWKIITVPGSSLLNNRQFSAILLMLNALKAIPEMIQISLWLLGTLNDLSILYSITNAFRIHERVLLTLPEAITLFPSLLDKHISLAGKSSNPDISISAYLQELKGKIALGYTEELGEKWKAIHETQIAKATNMKTPQDFREIRSLLDASISVDSAVSGLLRKYRNQEEHLKRITFCVLDNLRKGFGKIVSFWEFRSVIERHVDVLKFLSHGNTAISKATLAILQDQLNPKEAFKQMELGTKDRCDWMLTFLVQMIVSRSCSITVFLKSFAIETLGILADGKLSTPSSPIFFQNFLSLLNCILFVKSSKSISTHFFLTNSEIVALESIRHFDLIQEASFTLCLELSVTVYRLYTSISSFESSIQSEITLLYNNFFICLSWFRTKCLTSPAKIYKEWLYPKIQSQMNGKPITSLNVFEYGLSLLPSDEVQESKILSKYLEIPDIIKRVSKHSSVLISLDALISKNLKTSQEIASEILHSLRKNGNEEVLSLISKLQPEICIEMLKFIVFEYKSTSRTFAPSVLHKLVSIFVNLFKDGRVQGYLYETRRKTLNSLGQSLLDEFCEILFQKLKLYAIDFQEFHDKSTVDARWDQESQMRVGLASDIQLLSIFVPYMINHPSRTPLLYDQLQSLISLLLSEIVHGQGTETSLFEAVLDVVTWIMDDIPRDFGKEIFSWLAQQEIPRGLPKTMTRRLTRLFPFKPQDRMPINLKLTNQSDSPLFNLEHAHSPWTWGALVRDQSWKSLFEVQRIPFEFVRKMTAENGHPLRPAQKLEDLTQLESPVTKDKGKKRIGDHQDSTDLHTLKRIRSF